MIIYNHIEGVFAGVSEQVRPPRAPVHSDPSPRASPSSPLYIYIYIYIYTYMLFLSLLSFEAKNEFLMASLTDPIETPELSYVPV